MNKIILNNTDQRNYSIKSIDYTKKLQKKERLKVYNRLYYLNKKTDRSYYQDKYLNYYQNKKEWIKKYKLKRQAKVPTEYKKVDGEFNIDFS